MNEKLSRTLEALNRRGFHAQGFATAAQMRQAALALVKPGQSVGFGGSVTVQDLGIYEELCRQRHPVHWHWHADAAARKQTLLDALPARRLLHERQRPYRNPRFSSTTATATASPACSAAPKPLSCSWAATS